MTRYVNKIKYLICYLYFQIFFIYPIILCFQIIPKNNVRYGDSRYYFRMPYDLRQLTIQKESKQILLHIDMH